MRAPIHLLLSAATLLASPSGQVAPTPIEAFWALVSADGLKAVAAEQLIVECWDDAQSLWSTLTGEPAVSATSSAGDDSGARWTVEEGALVSPGGERLERLPAHRVFWFGWYAQYPETRLVRG